MTTKRRDAASVRGNVTDPFLISGPTCISFSTGRTSAEMLHRHLLAHGGTLPPDVHVVFTNTGKERRESLMFGAECERRWGVKIHVLEYAGAPIEDPFEEPSSDAAMVELREVTWATADTTGATFELLIRERKCLPGPALRFCTEIMKIRVMRDWMRRQGYRHWTRVVGLRADELGRVMKLRASKDGRKWWDVAVPLFTARVDESAIMSAWKERRGGHELGPWLAMPPPERPGWDLALWPHEGNCDACFLKSDAKRERIFRDHPEFAAWWIAQEKLGDAFARAEPGKRKSNRFRPNRPSYASLANSARNQFCLPIVDDDPTDLGACGCTD